jgi:hypothetical protein
MNGRFGSSIWIRVGAFTPWALWTRSIVGDGLPFRADGVDSVRCGMAMKALRMVGLDRMAR